MLAVISSMLATMQEAQDRSVAPSGTLVLPPWPSVQMKSVILCVLSAIKESLLRNLSNNRFKACL